VLFWKLYKRVLKLLAKQLPGYQVRRSLWRAAGYSIGKDVYIGEDLIVIDELEDKHLLHIGDRVAIAERVTLVLASRPNSSRFSPYVPTAHGPITVQDDAWLGTGCIIMPNVTIGRGAVVGAGSLVIRDIEPLTIVAGVPAKFIKKVECPSN
jgi:acetyltransferase-like isoleucine patch superfamily enzyme